MIIMSELETRFHVIFHGNNPEHDCKDWRTYWTKSV